MGGEDLVKHIGEQMDDDGYHDVAVGMSEPKKSGRSVPPRANYDPWKESTRR